MTEDTVSRPDGLRTPMAIHLADNAEHEVIPGLLGIIASRVELAAIEAQAAALSTPPPSLDHPVWHEWRTTCIHCGEPGMLNVSLIGPDERVDITKRAALEGSTP